MRPGTSWSAESIKVMSNRWTSEMGNYSGNKDQTPPDLGAVFGATQYLCTTLKAVSGFSTEGRDRFVSACKILFGKGEQIKLKQTSEDTRLDLQDAATSEGICYIL